MRNKEETKQERGKGKNAGVSWPSGKRVTNDNPSVPDGIGSPCRVSHWTPFLTFHLLGEFDHHPTCVLLHMEWNS